MPVNHVQSRVCVTILADDGSSLWSASASGVIVNKHFLNVTYSPCKIYSLFILNSIFVCTAAIPKAADCFD